MTDFSGQKRAPSQLVDQEMLNAPILKLTHLEIPVTLTSGRKAAVA